MVMGIYTRHSRTQYLNAYAEVNKDVTYATRVAGFVEDLELSKTCHVAHSGQWTAQPRVSCRQGM
jgi:hypothetical protein